MKMIKNQHLGIPVLAFLALCPAALCAGASSGKGFAVSLEAGLMRPADSQFRDIYGGGASSPQVRVAKGLGGGTSAWCAVSGFKKSGTVPVLDERAETRQTFLSLGAAYERTLLGGLSGRVDAGLALVAYREASMEIEEKGTRAGLLLGAGLSYPIYRGLSASASAGYILASKKLGDVSMKFGGLRAGLGLAYRFD
ncbi:MAG: hypothetical protein ACYDH0_07885 [Candidatus Aminicenantales bacterium]